MVIEFLHGLRAPMGSLYVRRTYRVHSDNFPDPFAETASSGENGMEAKS
jgi:hypothetical protein